MAVYSNSGFNPASLCSNFLGDAGNSVVAATTVGNWLTFAVTVPANSTAYFVVYELNAGTAGTCPFRLEATVTGSPCPVLAAPNNGVVAGTGTRAFGTVAIYLCNTGYFLVGSATATCAAGAMWTGTTPQCVGK